jgi:drug/metabolite transporter (DMT)-like permease
MGLAYYVVRERLEPQQVVGVALALLGVIAIAGAS